MERLKEPYKFCFSFREDRLFISCFGRFGTHTQWYIHTKALQNNANIQNKCANKEMRDLCGNRKKERQYGIHKTGGNIKEKKTFKLMKKFCFLD